MSLSKIERRAGRGVCAAAFGLLLLTACSTEKPPARIPETARVANPPLAAPPSDQQASIRISEELRKACKLPEGPKEAPRFDFDQASLRPRGQNILDDVAGCLKGGALQGRTIDIVGRADPRGSEEYNHALGTSRAEAARNYLTERGVPATSMNVLSRGEQGATGNDEESWELDRRVDLELGNSATAASNLSSLK